MHAMLLATDSLQEFAEHLLGPSPKPASANSVPAGQERCQDRNVLQAAMMQRTPLEVHAESRCGENRPPGKNSRLRREILSWAGDSMNTTIRSMREFTERLLHAALSAEGFANGCLF